MTFTHTLSGECSYFLQNKFTVGKYIAIGNSLFGAVKLTKIADFDKYRYSKYGIEFNAHRSFFLSDSGDFGQTLIMFGANMSLSVHIDNKKKGILILG